MTLDPKTSTPQPSPGHSPQASVDPSSGFKHTHQGMESYDAPEFGDNDAPDATPDDDDDDDWDQFQEPLPEGTVSLPRLEATTNHVKAGGAGGAGPWAMLDPHDSSSGNARPFRRGKTSRRPKVGRLGALPFTEAYSPSVS